MHLHAEPGGLARPQHRASLELFQSDIAPVLRRDHRRPAVAVVARGPGRSASRPARHAAADPPDPARAAPAAAR